MRNHVLNYIRLLILISLLVGASIVLVVVTQKYRSDHLITRSIDYHFASTKHLDILNSEMQRLRALLFGAGESKSKQQRALLTDARYLIAKHLNGLTELQTRFAIEPFGSQVDNLSQSLTSYSEKYLLEGAAEVPNAIAERQLNGILLQINQLLRLHEIENTRLTKKFHRDADSHLQQLLLATIIALVLGAILTRKLIGNIRQMLLAQQRTRDELFLEKELSQTTLASIGDAVITTDTQEKVDFMNPVAEKLTGWLLGEARGKPLTKIFNIINEETGQPITDVCKRVLQESASAGLSNHTVLIGRDGSTRSIEDSAAPIRNREGVINGVVIVFHDVTHARKMAQEISWQATHDGLTGLTNRNRFEILMQDLIESLPQENHHHAFLFLDLDQFKIVNDTCGHIAGDELLKQVSALLKSKVREMDTVARLGGDEFGILLASCPNDQAKRIAEQIRLAIREFHFVWQDKTFLIGCSIGLVAITPLMTSIDDIMRAADLACYAAKDIGRNRVQVYQADDNQVLRSEGEMGWVTRINEALQEDRFILYYQMIEALGSATGAGDKFEILVRMLDGNGEIVPPMSFIPAAERYHLMSNIDRWVIRNALQAIASMQETSVELCFVNISGQSLGDDKFVDYIIGQMQLYNVPGSKICFEITETAATTNFPEALAFFGALKEKGCRFALDDFGSGLSSFGYLKNMPVDFLKIGGDFVRDMLQDPVDRAMIESMNSVGHAMHIRTIAEFVESSEIADQLRNIGVDYGQGFGLSRPQPLTDYPHC